jgi:hypothetical protein
MDLENPIHPEETFSSHYSLNKIRSHIILAASAGGPERASTEIAALASKFKFLCQLGGALVVAGLYLHSTAFELL